jgi:hypothetical protein
MGKKKTINDFIFVFFVPFVVKKQPLRLGIKTQQQKLTTIPIHQTVLSYSTFPSCTISFIKKSPNLNPRSTSAGLRTRGSRRKDLPNKIPLSSYADIKDQYLFPLHQPFLRRA